MSHKIVAYARLTESMLYAKSLTRVDFRGVDFPKNPQLPGQAFQAKNPATLTNPASQAKHSRRRRTKNPQLPGEAFQAKNPATSTNPASQAKPSRRRRTQAKNPATPTSKTDEQANAGADFFTRPRRTQQHRRRSTKNTPISSPDSDEARTQAPISSPEPRRRTRSVIFSKIPIESKRHTLLNFKQHLTDPSNRLASWAAASDVDCCHWEAPYEDYERSRFGGYLVDSLQLVSKKEA
nr:hypothetical protein CFP56_31330 [Quercus suber]